jgi:toxin ParE1/3/4
MAKVIWTEPALAQFESIVDHIGLDKPEAARAVAARTLAALKLLERFVQLGRPIPEFPVPGHYQTWIKPCWFYYRLTEDRVVILHVRRAEKPLLLEYLLNEND